MLRPDVIAEITNAIYYGNDNIASRPLVDPRILDDVTLYPTPEIEAQVVPVRRGDRRDRAYSHAHLDADQDRRMNDENDEDIMAATESQRAVVSFHARCRTAPARTTSCSERYERDYVRELAGSHSAALGEAGAFAGRLSGDAGSIIRCRPRPAPSGTVRTRN